jgi:hypothetical protein
VGNNKCKQDIGAEIYWIAATLRVRRMREDNIRNDVTKIGFVGVKWGQYRGINFVETQ